MGRDVIIRTVLDFYPDAQAVYLFGTYLTPDASEESDADIAILLPHAEARQQKNMALGECWRALEDVLGKNVDLINLRMANTVLQNEIIEGGEMIFGQDDYAIDEFEMITASSYQKLNEERAGIVEDILKSGEIIR